MTTPLRQWLGFIVFTAVLLVAMAVAIAWAAGLLIQGCCTR